MMLDIRSMKIKMTTRSKASYIYLGTSIFLILLSLVMGEKWLINTQVAFICSMIVVFASFLSYKGMIERQLENGDIPEQRDELDNIDDKYELFDKDETVKELTKEEFVALYKQEREKSSNLKQSFSNLFKSTNGVFNPFRLIAYAFLSISMLFLIRNGLFSPLPFLIGIGAVPLSSMVLGFLIRE